MSVPSTPPTPTFAEEANGQADPLAGDWSEGLPGPLRAHGVPAPKRISLNGHVESPLQDVHDAHELLRSELSESPPADEPAPAFEPPSLSTEADSFPAGPDFDSDVTPSSPAPAFGVEDAAPETPAASATDETPGSAIAAAAQAADSAPTPWSEPVPSAQATSEIAWDETPSPSDAGVTPAEGWAPPATAATAAANMDPAPAAATPEAPVPEPAADAWAAPAAEQPPAPDETWSAQAAQPVEEWQPEATAADFEEVRAPAAEAAPAAAADWSSLSTGPDWSAPAAPPEAPAEQWGAPPPAPAPTDWGPAAPAGAEAEWSASETATPTSEGAWSPAEPAEAPAPEWSAPPEPPPGPAPAWNSPAVGASALEQLESEPPEPEPGAAKELFGAVPTGGMLAGDDDGENEYGPPEELASPEEVLRPVSNEREDPDLPEAVDEPARPRPQPLAAFRPAGAGALEVHGEHRVAIHTRGGRTLRGSVRDIDLSKSQFPLAPQGGGEIESIYHSDVKAIFFMLAPGEKASEGDGAKVRVSFADGRVIEGVREGADAKHGFFLVPLDAARTNTRRIYVAREATRDIKDS